MLMGRRTYAVVRTFEEDWPYGDTPIIVATNRPLETIKPSVQSSQGIIGELVVRATSMAGDRDVYLDGGNLIREALDAGLVDEVAVTLLPVILGEGIPLFAGTRGMHRLELQSHRAIGSGIVELVYKP
jgi:dihydrofolate reductase